MKRTLELTFALTLIAIFSIPVAGQSFDEQFDHWPVTTKINGTVIIDNGLKDKDLLSQAVGKLDKGSIKIFAAKNVEMVLVTRLMSSLRKSSTEIELGVIESFGAIELNDDQQQTGLIAVYAGKPVTATEESSLKKLSQKLNAWLKQGGKVIVDRHVSEALHQINSDYRLFPDCVIECLPEKQNGAENDLLSKSLESKHRKLGISLETDSLLMLRGRKITVTGNGSATFMLPAGNDLELKTQTIRQRKSRRTPPNEWLVDLTQWRRMAIDRAIKPFPAKKPELPLVKNGTLVIVGGGGMPRGLMSQFIELAGGKEKAKLVYIPCSERDDLGTRSGTVEMWKRMGVKHATMVHTKDRNKANGDKKFLEPLQDATGIWFGGGRQWNFADSYYGTKAHQLMKEVLARGGVVGGSSAGASIQARFLARATPIGNTSILAPGYERGGLGFISGVAIDQHFSQRRRQKDMTQLVDKYPQLLGIGIDEATALIVKKSEGRVIGRGQVFFYDRNMPVEDGNADYISLPAGSVYNLARRTIVKDTTKKKDGERKKVSSNR